MTEISTSSLDDLVNTYCRAWSEPDPDARRQLLDEAWDADGTYTDPMAEVAGRTAYQLVLGPKDSASLVGQVRIAIDAEQHIPLRVQVYAKNAPTPAFQVGFSQVSFDVPDAANFQFSPPPGATVTESTLGSDPAAGHATTPGTAAKPTRPAGAAEPTVVGTGWTSVLVAKVPATEATPETTAPESSAPLTAGSAPGEPVSRGSAANLSAILGSLPSVSGDWGSGRLLQSALFSVLITDDGRIIAGAVAPEKLYEAAAQ